eukprot:11225687-Lingulodinium_polyedra.AAC.1
MPVKMVALGIIHCPLVQTQVVQILGRPGGPGTLCDRGWSEPTLCPVADDPGRGRAALVRVRPVSTT